MSWFPRRRVIGLLVNPRNPAQSVVVTRDLQTAAANLGLQLIVLHASAEGEVEDAFTTLAQKRAGALVIGSRCILQQRDRKVGRHWLCDIWCLRFSSFASS